MCGVSPVQIYSPAKAVEASEYVLLRVVCVLAMKQKAKTDFLHVCWMIQVNLVVMGSCKMAFVNQ